MGHTNYRRSLKYLGQAKYTWALRIHEVMTHSPFGDNLSPDSSAPEILINPMAAQQAGWQTTVTVQTYSSLWLSKETGVCHWPRAPCSNVSPHNMQESRKWRERRIVWALQAPGFRQLCPSTLFSFYPSEWPIIFPFLLAVCLKLMDMPWFSSILSSSMGMTEDEMFGWHHRLSGHEFEQAPGDSKGRGSLMCCSPQGRQKLDTTEWLNNNSDQTAPHTPLPGCCNSVLGTASQLTASLKPYQIFTNTNTSC